MAEEFIATGRRKTSIARVRIKPGSGKITINKKDYTEYFVTEQHQMFVKQCFEVLGDEAKYDTRINVYGGGLSGQAGACRLGIARALSIAEEENRPALKKNGFLKRDPRKVERKKYGFRKARRSEQFSKR